MPNNIEIGNTVLIIWEWWEKKGAAGLTLPYSRSQVNHSILMIIEILLDLKHCQDNYLLEIHCLLLWWLHHHFHQC